MIMYAVMFMCNIAAGKLVATGAFEIYSGSGDLLFSKINSGMNRTLEHASSANVGTQAFKYFICVNLTGQLPSRELILSLIQERIAGN